MEEPMEEPKLAELTESLLDRATFEAFLDDLEACTQVLDVLVKGGTKQRTDAKPVGLREAGAMLVEGAVHALQIRYRYDGSEWRDTLLWSPEGLRIVRMNMSDMFGSP